MENVTLGKYVAERVKAGVGRAEIREELTAVGWSEEEAEVAFRDGLISLGVPVPTEANRPTLSRKSSAVDVVINFFSFAMLVVVVSALGTIYFQIINLKLPDVLDATTYYSEYASMRTIHYSIAALLVGFPLYYGAMRIWFRKFREDEGRVESKLSKWLTYLVLLVAAGTIVGDLIATIFMFLQGEITARFGLKALVILAIAGGIFGFYFLERRKIQYKKTVPRKVFQLFGIGTSIIIAIGIILGFFVSGSPETARKRAFDQERTQNLSSLSSCIQSYTFDIGTLPASLDMLKRSETSSFCALPNMYDPETGEPYEYRIVVPSRIEGMARVGEFELCATFSLASNVGGSIWNEHTAGRSCDTVTVQLGKPVQPVTSPTAAPWQVVE